MNFLAGRKPIPQRPPISFYGYAPGVPVGGHPLGSHTDEVLSSLDIRDDEIEGRRKNENYVNL